jgi:hypothetical protein
MTTSQSLSTLRASTTRKLAALPLPDCFQSATINAALNAQERTTQSAKASRRRLLDKATKLASVEVGR